MSNHKTAIGLLIISAAVIVGAVLDQGSVKSWQAAVLVVILFAVAWAGYYIGRSP